MAGGLRVEAVDPRDDEAFGAWFGVLDASLSHQRPGEPHWLPQEQREIALRRLRPDAVETGPLLLARRRDGLPVGAARLTLPQRDNLLLATAVLEVHPAHRRQGVATALLTELVALARAGGRTTLTTEVDETPGGCPGPAFLQASGFVFGLREARRDLPLPVPGEVLDRLAAESAAASPAYDVVVWHDRTPEHLLEDRARLSQAMSVEVPWGGVPHEEEAWDAERVRTGETGLLAQERTWCTAAAAFEGRLVAFTDLGVPRARAERAYQWSTLVQPEHRGHRLGLRLKVAALRALQQAHPGTRLVTTWNAESNRPMIAVNEALGYRVNGGLSIWTSDLERGPSRHRL